MLPLPARTTEIFETVEVSAEIWTNHTRAHRTEGVLQIGVDLYLCVCGVGVLLCVCGRICVCSVVCVMGQSTFFVEKTTP